MAVTAHHHVGGVTTDQYDEAMRRIRDRAGTGARAGQISHICFGSPDDLQILSTWETREAFDRFFSTALRPVLEEMNLDPTHQVYEVHNLMQASELAKQ